MISIKSEVSKLQLTIDGLDEWCNVSDLHLKFRKCVVMMILNKLYIINGNYLFDVHIFKSSTLDFVERICHDFVLIICAGLHQ